MSRPRPRNARPLTVWIPTEVLEAFIARVHEERPTPERRTRGDARVPETVRELIRAYAEGRRAS